MPFDNTTISPDNKTEDEVVGAVVPLPKKSLFSKFGRSNVIKISLAIVLLLALSAAGFFVFKNNNFKADEALSVLTSQINTYTWPTDASFSTFTNFDHTTTDGNTISLARVNNNKTVILRPTSDVAKGLSASVGADNWAMVDDNTADDDGTYVQADFVPVEQNIVFDDYGYGVNPVPNGSQINSITVYTRTYNSQWTYPELLLADGGHVWKDKFSDNEVWATHSSTWTTNPVTNAPWTIQEITDLKLSAVIGNTNGIAKLSQVYAEVSYSDQVQYETAGTATLENFTFREGKVRIQSATIDKSENGQQIKVEFSTDNFNWQEDVANLDNVSQLFVRATLATATPSQTPVLNKINIGYIPVAVPQKPTNASPAPNTSFADRKPELKASDFVQPDGAQFASSEWEMSLSPVLTSTGKFKTPVPGNNAQLGPVTTYTPNMALLPDKKYFWHVRYKDSYNMMSAWSDPTFLPLKICHNRLMFRQVIL